MGQHHDREVQLRAFRYERSRVQPPTRLADLDALVDQVRSRAALLTPAVDRHCPGRPGPTPEAVLTALRRCLTIAVDLTGPDLPGGAVHLCRRRGQVGFDLVSWDRTAYGRCRATAHQPHMRGLLQELANWADAFSGHARVERHRRGRLRVVVLLPSSTWYPVEDCCIDRGHHRRSIALPPPGLPAATGLAPTRTDR